MREAVGRRVKLSLRRRVQLEVKGDKWESRVLVSVTKPPVQTGSSLLPLNTTEEEKEDGRTAGNSVASIVSLGPLPVGGACMVGSLRGVIVSPPGGTQ